MPPPPHRHLRVALLLIGCLAFFCPVAWALVLDLAHWSARPPTPGDLSLIEHDLRTTLRGLQWVGPYSRFGWYHPGPLMYYVLAPLYLLSGESRTSVFFSAELVYASSLAGAVPLFWHRRRDDAPLLLMGLALIAAWLWTFEVHQSFWRRPPWNPTLTMGPYILLCLLSVRIGLGWLAGLPLAVFLHAFVVQGHVGYLPAATGILCAGPCWAMYHRPATPLATWLRSRWRVGITSTAVALALWGPVLWGGSDNLLAIASFMWQARAPRILPGTAAKVLAHTLSEPATSALTLLGTPETIVDGSCILLTLGLFASVVGILLRSREPTARALACISLVQMVCIALSIFAIRGRAISHMTSWMPMASLTGWFALAYALRRGRAWEGLAMGSTLLLVVLAIGRVDAVRTQFDQMWTYSKEDSPFLQIADLVEDTYRESSSRPLLRATGQGSWRSLTAVVLELDKRDVPLLVHRRHRHLFGTGLDYARAAPDIFLFSSSPVDELSPVFESEDYRGIHVYHQSGPE